MQKYSLVAVATLSVILSVATVVPNPASLKVAVSTPELATEALAEMKCGLLAHAGPGIAPKTKAYSVTTANI